MLAVADFSGGFSQRITVKWECRGKLSFVTGHDVVHTLLVIYTEKLWY